MISGSGQPQITREVVLKHKIPLLELNNQLEYVKPFIALDEKINLEESKLTKLNELKKGLMQSMFV